MKTEQIIKLIETETDGFTADFNGNLPKLSGYLVAITDNKTNKPTKTLINKLYAFSRMIPEKVYIGGWRDSNTGLYYVDLSVCVSDRETALQTAKVFKQKAVFDIGKLETVFV